MKAASKILILILLTLTILPSASSYQVVKINNYELETTILNEDGLPIKGIQVITGKLELQMEDPFPIAKPLTTQPILTDDSGKAVIRFESVQEASGNVTFFQVGYYTTYIRNNPWVMPDGFDGKLRTAEVHGILKPIKNPIPMAVSRGGRLWLNQLDRVFGYDLMTQSMLPPHGHGEHADIEFMVSGEYHDRDKYDLKLHVRFPNPDDGIVEFLTPQRTSMEEPIMNGSIFISDYEAPETGYINQITRMSQKGADDARSTGDSDHRRNFYFRVRTQKDEIGNIINAHYGKIYGDFRFAGSNVDVRGNYASVIWIATYFNPTPNDRNVEFDTKRNLHPLQQQMLSP